tara:strand:- start:377 stop:718 length:342 start_codon:yes stop_codon:yes gene_type:complete
LQILNKDVVLASSSAWVGSLLNFLPGIGTGYIYQRRWLPYFLTSGAVIAWLILGIILKGEKESNQLNQFIGLSGLLFISLITSVEAYLAHKKALSKTQQITKNLEKESKSWFK